MIHIERATATTASSYAAVGALACEGDAHPSPGADDEGEGQEEVGAPGHVAEVAAEDGE